MEFEKMIVSYRLNKNEKKNFVPYETIESFCQIYKKIELMEGFENLRLPSW